MNQPGTTLEGRFRKKPVVIEAMQYLPDTMEVAEVAGWMASKGVKYAFVTVPGQEYPNLSIRTLEGTMQASPGDWIIRGVQGEFYPCKPDIFEATYDPVYGTAPETAEEGPLLGLATTRQLLAELSARAEVGGYADYRTVGDGA